MSTPAESTGNDDPMPIPEESDEGVEHSFAVQLLDGFQGRIEPPRFSLLYQINLLLVAALMILLPLLYLILIAALIGAVWWWAQAGLVLFAVRGGGIYGLILRLIGYAGPLLAGGIAVLFMFKPLFARRPSPVQALAINPGAEPVFFAYLSRICERVRARPPAAIELSGTVNASASLRRGFFSRELTVTVGLPLVGTLTVQELAGVLAHEFGHFTQGFGMRLCYLIGKINLWFARVVFDRDAWDHFLDELAEGSDSLAVSVIVGMCRAAVGLSRLALRGLMTFGHIISASALRQMEYGADEVGAQIAGSAAYEATLLRIQSLALAEHAVRQEISKHWEATRRLPDDLPALVGKADAALPSSVREDIQTRAGFASTGWLDTHPSLADRLKRIRRLAAPGVFHLEWPATSLFQEFSVISRQVTLVHYRDEIGLPVGAENLVPVLTSAPARPVPEPENPAEPGTERPRIRLRVKPEGSETASAETPPDG